MQVSPAYTQQIDDDEVAACLAAIAVILAERSLACKAKRQVDGASMSGWLTACRVEACGHVKRRFVRPLSRSLKASPWRTASLPHLPAILFLSGVALLILFLFSDNMSLAQSPEQSFSGQALGADSWTQTTGRSMGDQGQPASLFSPCPPRLPPRPSPVLSRPAGSSDNEQGASQGQSPAALQDSAESSISFVRVALLWQASQLEIGLPDGALLKDCATGSILAQLPPASCYQVCLKQAGGFARLCFAGTCLNTAASKIALRPTSNPYRDVSFIAGARHMQSLPGGLLEAQIVSSPSFKFSLPVLSSARPSEGAQDTTPPVYELVACGQDGLLALNGKLYRGTFLLKPRVSGQAVTLTAINKVALEDYLLSVVPSEMPSTWPLEALKAQSIAARSYATASVGKHESEGFDVKATTEDQVYSGVSAESAASNQAVADTQGMVLKHQGKVIEAFFHSSAGGCTELSENVWSKPIPYLKSVPDYDDDSPYFSWSRSFDVSTLEKSLSRTGKDTGSLLLVLPLSRGPSQRVRSLMVAGTLGTLILNGEETRRLLNLPSTVFNVGAASDSYIFAGRGFGHGLGLSQWGARKLAECGYNASQILSYYYREITIDQL